MRKPQHFAWWGLLLLLILHPRGWTNAQEALSDEAVKDLLQRSSFVLLATVTQSEGVSVKGIDTSIPTVLLRVDSVVEKPKSIAIADGDQVTMVLKNRELARMNQRAVFFAESLILSKKLVLREVGSEAIPATSEVAFLDERKKSIQQLRGELIEADLKNRVKASDMIVVGRVVSVRGLTLRAGGPRPGPISEHTPNWKEAVIKVSQGIKGAEADQEVIVHFAQSMDVAWFKAPKFKVGQEGTFLLQLDKSSGTPKAMHSGKEVSAYSAMDFRSILAKGEAAKVKKLLGQ